MSQHQLLLQQEKTKRQKETSCVLSSAQQREKKSFSLRSWQPWVSWWYWQQQQCLRKTGATRFFLTTVTKSPSEGFSPVTMDGSGSEFLGGAVTTAILGLPTAAHTTSLYDLAVALIAMADEAASRRVDGT
jgi:hypothetical protein